MLNHRESKKIPTTTDTPNIGSRLLGTFVGGWTGAAAGVRRSHQICKDTIDIYPIGPVVYLLGVIGTTVVTAPFHGIKGAITGATHGLVASTKYPAMVENKRNAKEIQEHFTNMSQHFYSFTNTTILTAKEEKRFSDYLNIHSSSKSRSMEKKAQELNLAFNQYLQNVQKIKDTKNPLFVSEEVWDFVEFKKFVDEARKNGTPIGCNKKDITFKLPEKIYTFVQCARNCIRDLPRESVENSSKNKKSTSTEDMLTHLTSVSKDSTTENSEFVIAPPPTNPYAELSPEQYHQLFPHLSIKPSAPPKEVGHVPHAEPKVKRSNSEPDILLSKNSSSHFHKKTIRDNTSLDIPKRKTVILA